jgi:hypothetical protein
MLWPLKFLFNRLYFSKKLSRSCPSDSPQWWKPSIWAEWISTGGCGRYIACLKWPPQLCIGTAASRSFRVLCLVCHIRFCDDSLAPKRCGICISTPCVISSFLFPAPFVRLSHGYSPVKPYDKELFWQILQHSSCHSPRHSRGLALELRM